MKKKKIISDIERIKSKIKKNLIRLSYYEKIRRVIEMQKISAKLNRGRRKVYVWDP